MSGKSDWKARRRETKLSRCRHFHGVGGVFRDADHEPCDLGIDLKTVRDETQKPFGLACLGASAPGCAKFSPFTLAEIEAEEARLAESFRKIAICRQAIVNSGLKRGPIDCPACGKSKSLHFSVSSYNGHIHASCPECVSWME